MAAETPSPPLHPSAARDVLGPVARDAESLAAALEELGFSESATSLRRECRERAARLGGLRKRPVRDADAGIAASRARLALAAGRWEELLIELDNGVLRVPRGRAWAVVTAALVREAALSAVSEAVEHGDGAAAACAEALRLVHSRWPTVAGDARGSAGHAGAADASPSGRTPSPPVPAGVASVLADAGVEGFRRHSGPPVACDDSGMGLVLDGLGWGGEGCGLDAKCADEQRRTAAACLSPDLACLAALAPRWPGPGERQRRLMLRLLFAAGATLPDGADADGRVVVGAASEAVRTGVQAMARPAPGPPTPASWHAGASPVLEGCAPAAGSSPHEVWAVTGARLPAASAGSLDGGGDAAESVIVVAGLSSGRLAVWCGPRLMGPPLAQAVAHAGGVCCVAVAPVAALPAADAASCPPLLLLSGGRDGRLCMWAAHGSPALPPPDDSKPRSAATTSPSSSSSSSAAAEAGEGALSSPHAPGTARLQLLQTIVVSPAASPVVSASWLPGARAAFWADATGKACAGVLMAQREAAGSEGEAAAAAEQPAGTHAASSVDAGAPAVPVTVSLRRIRTWRLSAAEDVRPWPTTAEAGNAIAGAEASLPGAGRAASMARVAEACKADDAVVAAALRGSGAPAADVVRLGRLSRWSALAAAAFERGQVHPPWPPSVCAGNTTERLSGLTTRSPVAFLAALPGDGGRLVASPVGDDLCLVRRPGAGAGPSGRMPALPPGVPVRVQARCVVAGAVTWHGGPLWATGSEAGEASAWRPDDGSGGAVVRAHDARHGWCHSGAVCAVAWLQPRGQHGPVLLAGGDDGWVSAWSCPCPQ